MKKGLSLHIGLNYVDPNYYEQWQGKLNACELDAKDMQSIADNQGFESEILLGHKATRENVIKSIQEKIDILDSGDIFLISFSGHGSKINTEDMSEKDNKDETWCLFNGLLIDNELKHFWSLFKKNVRILVISDSCYSGGILESFKHLSSEPISIQSVSANAKLIPDEHLNTVYRKNEKFYQKLRKNYGEIKDNEIIASVKLISSSKENQISYENECNGRFTEHLKKTWKNSNFEGNYEILLTKIEKSMEFEVRRQIPTLKNIGELNAVFNNQKPFTI